VIAVTCAVKAVTGDVTAVTRGRESRDPCAGRDRRRATVTAVAGGLLRGPRADAQTSSALLTDVARSLARPKL
jgi:hypothetical protein